MKVSTGVEGVSSDAIDLKIQLVILDEKGYLLDSNDRLFPIDKKLFCAFEEEVFFGMETLFEILPFGEDIKLECIETEFFGKTSIYDFTVCPISYKNSRAFALSIYDLEDVYRKVVDLRQERNEAEIFSKQLKIAYKKLDQAYQKESETNRKLQEMQLEVLYHERMASVAQLAAGMAHEINNPLNYILNGARALKSTVDGLIEKHEGENNGESDDTIQLKTLLDVIERGSVRIQEVVHDLQLFNDYGSSEWKWVNIHESLDRTMTLLSHQFENQIKVKKSYDESLDLVHCIPIRMNQAFLNLLTNATTFVPPDRTCEITITTKRSESHVIIIIQDNGQGIPEEMRMHIFDPFYTTKEAGSGKGLGLSICYKIVEEHHGELSFESDQNIGTSFCIKLPIGGLN